MLKTVGTASTVFVYDGMGQMAEEYGQSQGIIHVVGVKGATGTVMVGAGVHSGRKGPQSKTAGCIRTCTEAMTTINKIAKSDPLKTITVKNNDQNVLDWLKQLVKTKGAEHEPRRPIVREDHPN